MLELRPNCECCDKDLPNGSPEAMIYTYECTFCMLCVTDILKGVCPNCGGDFQKRPTRPVSKLANNPPSTKRIYNPVLMQRK